MRYYYQQMSKVHQEAYHAIMTGMLALEPSFSVPKLEQKELSDIFFKMRLDCPEIFYGTGFKYKFYADAKSVEFIPQYLFEKSKIKEHQKAMENRVVRLARQAEAMSETDKEKYIHDFICTQVNYDKLKKQYSHEIIGPLGQGVGVCEGIAKTVKILCDRLGIWCIIAISEANPEKGIKYRHAWNVVRIGGKYYHLDCTFDNTLSRHNLGSLKGGSNSSDCEAAKGDAGIRYDYLNLSDKMIFKDHEPVITAIPECTDGEHFYYREKKLSFTKKEEVEKRAVQALKKRKTFLFHWRGGYLTKEMLQELLQMIDDLAKSKERHARVSLNWAQAVIQVKFIENIPESSFIMEQVNEGEEQLL